MMRSSRAVDIMKREGAHAFSWDRESVPVKAGAAGGPSRRQTKPDRIFEARQLNGCPCRFSASAPCHIRPHTARRHGEAQWDSRREKLLPQARWRRNDCAPEEELARRDHPDRVCKRNFGRWDLGFSGIGRNSTLSPRRRARPCSLHRA
jgi:hypothetical protein